MALPVAEKVIAVWDESAKVALSFGTPAGFQFSALFHSPLAGLLLHVDLLIYSS
ncbi:hypothetical protein [Candidatus Reidiella endopervernicosa]|uniref:Uncharacterized protein n=1 Tax=Candidatus Reidiella endopervernicosa TaxID=2738883 RepID=A0A6N0HTD2_9GAMM|nr:hypothetical protein [Candidatus Reidiella endopervernicosa]QKQ25639.1 hypothetical protein HUE57_04530 [Candidatus Reidiella endopervernicosa]